MQNTMHEKTVLVVGGSAGLGLAVARRVHRAGARVVIASRYAEERREAIVAAVGPRTATYALDVTQQGDVPGWLEAVGSIDHLVITVRPAAPSAPLAELDLEAARAVFETKLWGPCGLIRAVLPQLAPDGSITLTSGIAGEKIYAGAIVMAMVNAATETLCRALAVELAPRRVNVVSPGFVAPKDEAIDAYAQGFPVGRLAQADDVAETCLYALTHPYVTGTTLWVDGGARLVR